jgi:hypothetical protein
MPLPRIEAPTYTLKLPSNGKEVKFRPFLVREEKALMFAQQSEDEQVMNDTLRDVIESCTFDKIKANELALYDLEYIFLQIRIKSVGSDSKLLAKCKTCSVSNDIVIDLEKIDVINKKGNDGKIQLFKDVGVKMKAPTYDSLQKLRKLNLDDPEQIIKLITLQIDYVYDSNSIYKSSEQSEEELIEFVSNMTQVQLQQIKQYFESIPRLAHDHVYKCKNCSTENKIHIEGLSNFF